jgi:serine/threonine-protein kinase
MVLCPLCNAPAPPEARYCPICGAAVGGPGTLATRTQVGGAGTISSASTSATGPAQVVAPAAARFLPGTVLAGRYRIVALLGRGGMGEVYRADDLKLGEPVALKLLPERLSHDPDGRARLLAEVKLARSVGHPSVCRVYDVGETEGLVFLSMEYVDGENLASLLRRVGRLPEDRAIQVAREICAGLAAAHDRGILHRDLKPANVMIDGRGRARLADFGLASLAGKVDADDNSGTPAYMSPEQLSGGEVSVRSDVYSLGLVLYELFTGKHAFAAATLDELMRMRHESAPTHPSRHIPNLDPAVERTILRCLESDPAARPASTMAVAAGLPGGDALALALAAGVTPSPELVAAAGGAGTLRPGVGAACLAFVAVGLLVCARVADWTNPLLRLPDKRVEVLGDRAEGLLRAAGYPEAADHVYGLDYDMPYLRYRGTWRPSAEPWSPIYFWYRESPLPMLTVEFTEGGVDFQNPKPVVPGMAGVRLDGQGRLLELLAVPGGLPPADPPKPAAPFDWRPLFAEARLDPAQFQAAEPELVPPVFAEERKAWVSPSGASPGVPLRVEAGSFQGRPVYFRIVGPWDGPMPRRTVKYPVYLSLAFLVVGGVLARRNLRQGRGDAKGALWFGGAATVGVLLGWIVLPGRLVVLRDPSAMFLGAAVALMMALLAGVSYLALEPFVRHHWPHTMTSWQRVVTGSGRDPRVSRDILIGMAAGIPLALCDQLGLLALKPGLVNPDMALSTLLGTREILANMIRGLSIAAMMATLFMLVLVLLRVLLRAQWPAVIAAVFFLAGVASGLRPALFPLRLVFMAMVVAVLLRWGLIAAAVAMAAHGGIAHTVMTTHLGAWYADPAIVAIVTTLGAAAYGFLTSRAGRPRRFPGAA